MTTSFWRLVGVILISGLPPQAVYADVAPPVQELVILPLAALIGLGLFVAGIVFVSFLVIRAIKKNHTPKDGAGTNR